MRVTLFALVLLIGGCACPASQRLSLECTMPGMSVKVAYGMAGANTEQECE